MKRTTIQRTLTLQAVRRLQSHATAEEIYLAVASEHPAVSRATVYRNLNDLAESGEIRKLEVPGCADHFDHMCHNHHHVRCVRCGKVFDVDMPYLGDLTENIQDAHGFCFSGYDLVFRGLCPACRGKDLTAAEGKRVPPVAAENRAPDAGRAEMKQANTGAHPVMNIRNRRKRK